MRLKHDVYYSITDDMLEVTQLIPDRRRWRIRLPVEERDSVVEFLDMLILGMTSVALKDYLDQASAFINGIFELLCKESLASEFNTAEYKESVYRRQYEVFDSWDRKGISPEDYQKKLADARVLVVGAGGVGVAVANNLCSCGLGNINVVDFDIIEPSNLARQFLYYPTDLGKFKTEILAERLNLRGMGKVVPRNIQLSRDNVGAYLDEFDGKFDMVTGVAFPAIEEEMEFFKVILDRKIPILCLGEHYAGPIFEDILEAEEFMNLTYDRFDLQRAHDRRRDTAAEDRHPSYAPEIGVVCSIAADAIVRYISGYAPNLMKSASFCLDPVTSCVIHHDLKAQEQ